MSTVTIHGFAPSTYTRTARMAAIEKGVDHELRPLAYGTPDHFALHPFGKMPVMTHGETTVYETLAIVDYLDKAFGGPALMPADGAARAAALTDASVAVDYAYRPVVHTKGEGDTPDPDNMAGAAKVFDWLEARLNGHDWLGGANVGLGDLMFAPMLDYHIAQCGDGHVVDARPRLRAWFARSQARPSFAQTAAG